MKNPLPKVGDLIKIHCSAEPECNGLYVIVGNLYKETDHFLKAYWFKENRMVELYDDWFHYHTFSWTLIS